MTRFDAAIGRYVYLDLEAVEYRVYFEESGGDSERIPLLLQHTAGADGRQWRHVLEDRALAERFRMIAYDLPYHGKSLPPAGVEWWKQEYKLTKDFLMRVPRALARALGLHRPVFMGSSIGGHLALDLALHHPDEFRAVIGLEAAAATPGGYLDLWNHPRVSNAFKASVMYGLMSPTAPESARRETAWGYSQGAPPVFKGDLYYHAVDHAMGDRAREIDASRVAVFLLTGEYDWSTPPALSQAVAEQIPGAHFQTMEGLGHFPMSEDPERFLGYIRPVLEKIAAIGSGAA
jgi:pimeloyl-ACP methyl ester carboxylesterase